MVNHSCEPNAGIKKDIHLVALKNIQPREEIFFDYSTTMDDKRWTMKCHCDKPQCRHKITDFKHLPKLVKKNT